jgi:hypothetical protein
MGLRRPIKRCSWFWACTSAASHLRVAAVVAIAALLPGCTVSQFAELPTAVGGQSPNAPHAPANPPAFPPVHDMPPARPVPVMTEQELQQAEAELIAARDRHAGPAPKKPSQPVQAQKKPLAADKPAPAKDPPPGDPVD